MRTTVPLTETGFAPSQRVFKVAQLEELGVPQSVAYRRARAGGPWTRLAPGVVLVAPGPATVEDLIAAALLLAGPESVVTGLHAARLHGMRTPPADAVVHVLIPHGRKVQNQPGMRFERTTRLPIPQTINGIPVAPLARAVIDAARTWQSRQFTKDLLVEAIQQGRKCHPRILAEEMALGSRRGTALPREILREITTNSRTTAEEKAFEIVADSGLPTPLWNVPVLTAEGEYIGCPDLWFDEVGLAVEFGFFGYRHTREEDSTTALRRKKRYEVHGITVLNIPGGRLRQQPAVVLAELREAFFAAAKRGRPEVLAFPSVA